MNIAWSVLPLIWKKADVEDESKVMDFSKTDNIYPDTIWDPMVIVRNERYMFVQHVPIMYLTYTYLLSLIFWIMGYMLGTC